MRGTPLQETHRPRPTGIIPAYAGNTPDVARRACLSGDHPRVCGEHLTDDYANADYLGSSPRMRGTPHDVDHGAPELGIIPAYEGNTPAACWKSWQAWDHPRVCGEHRSLSDLSDLEGGSSPRMRGTPVSRLRFYRIRGIIPAYAGNTALKLKI